MAFRTLELTYEQSRRIIEGYYGQKFISEYDCNDFGQTEKYDRPAERNKERSDGEIIRMVAETCRQHGAKGLVLYGSYAKGLIKQGSDFDFAVTGYNGSFYELLDDLDSIRTLKKIDMVDYDKLSDGILKEEIDRYGRKIYWKI